MADGWHVTGQRGTSQLVNGRLVQAMQIDVETVDGTDYQLIIPEAMYTPENVKAQIDAWYERHQGVAGL